MRMIDIILGATGGVVFTWICVSSSYTEEIRRIKREHVVEYNTEEMQVARLLLWHAIATGKYAYVLDPRTGKVALKKVGDYSH